jgi:transcriptional regulator
MKPDRVPERLQTVRSELKRVLREGSFTARDLSACVGISEKDVAQHLEHVGRSVRDSGERLTVEHARCLGCGVRLQGPRAAHPTLTLPALQSRASCAGALRHRFGAAWMM